jgi:hypothetical protein
MGFQNQMVFVGLFGLNTALLLALNAIDPLKMSELGNTAVIYVGNVFLPIFNVFSVMIVYYCRHANVFKAVANTFLRI